MTAPRAEGATPPTVEPAPSTSGAVGSHASDTTPTRCDPDADTLVFRLTLSPESGFRTFRDSEPDSAPKYYTASAVAAVGARFELYPLVLVSPAPAVLRDIGITAAYSRAFGFESRDPDTPESPRVDTQWHQLGFGLRFRTLGETGPLSLGLTAGFQRWVFDFDTPPAVVPVAVGKYTLLPIGADVRYAWRSFSIFGDARFLLPVTISPPDGRSPSGARFGLHAALAAALRLSSLFEIELRAAYMLVGYSLPNALANKSARASVLDESVVLGAGASFLFSR